MVAREGARAEQVLKVLCGVSWVVVGGYGVALCYRFGVFRKILPKSTATAIEGVVEKIKAKTEPLGDARRYVIARRHLIHVYSLSSLGIVFAAMGGTTFFVFPKVPIAIPIAFALLPSTLLLFLPKTMMLHMGRVASLLTSCFAFGYSFGPIGWVVWDSLDAFLTVMVSTMAGLCVPLFLTRGMISFVLSSQLLSCTLSLAAVTTPLLFEIGASSSASSPVPFPVTNLPPGSNLEMLRRADVNVLLSLQLLSNLGINLLHTLPTIVYFVRWRGSEEELLDSVDPLKESMCICAGAAYVLWRSFSWACRRLVLTVAKDDTKDTSRELQKQRGHFANLSFYTQHVSGVGASLLLFLWYVRAVSALQRGETVATLEMLRRVCAQVSPVSLIIRNM
ncbi:putative retrotransposon hot spot (RHS) protein [Trypanosoma rangeli]|uniref:Putative retrotransposon hot spot (RHS) protein n=1 Tax=Trypanosoma rangeli TaxID=5698 RepID=A0A422P095_TRYRA|nr:putative retrotransposon hot spot (RHS) protein [Trypanosoma rangeli]RNF11109.1 putative retrotransposon hot spot (RHS) protein [Trypanosoma rangeli]|eukprot:RNF11109.1 putative retrotransposon hot spot (RHS) protein [Trypanosoma rangeli]